MNKSILIIDTPICCKHCPCFMDESDVFKDIYLCRALGEYIISSEEMHQNCPLKPLSQKKYWNDNVMDCSQENAFDKGYNACLDEILGE